MAVANPPEVRLRRGGDQHSVLSRIVAAGGHGIVWVDPDLACHAVTPSVRKLVLPVLIRKGWVQQVGGTVQATAEGLLALENV